MRVAQLLGLRQKPREPERPETEVGLPWLAAQLADRYQSPAQVAEQEEDVEDGWLQYLSDEGVRCVSVALVTKPSGKRQPQFVFTVEGQKGKQYASAAQVAEQLGLRPVEREDKAAGMMWLATNLQKQYQEPEESLAPWDACDWLDWLQRREVTCTAASQSGSPGQMYAFAIEKQKGRAVSAAKVAGKLGLKPKEVNRPATSEGLPWLAAQLGLRYQYPLAGEPDWELLLRARGVTCTAAYWRSGRPTTQTPLYRYRVAGVEGPLKSVVRVAEQLGLQPLGVSSDD